MLRALRQHEDLTALLVRILDLRRNRDVSRRIAGDVPKNILNARLPLANQSACAVCTA